MGQIFKNYNRRGLVGHWKYHGNVSKANTWYDASSNGNHGTLISSATVANDGFSGNGTSDYVNCGSASNLKGMSELSIFAWIKPDTGTRYDPIIGMGGGGSGTSNNYLFLKWGVGDKIAVSLSGTAWTLSTGAVSIGEWNHVGFTYDGTTVRFYINGELSGSDASHYSGNIRALNYDCKIAAQGDVTSYYFDGKTDDNRIYNRALTSTEISAIYNTGRGSGFQPSTINSSEIVLWMGTGVSPIPGKWYDMSGNGNHGTLVGNAFVNKDGVNLDGTESHIILPDEVSVAGLSEVSLYMMVYLNDNNGRCIYGEGVGSGDYWRFAFENSYLVSGKITFSVRDTNSGDTGTRKNLTSSVSTPIQEWFLLGVSYSVANSLCEISINGETVASRTNTYPFTNTLPYYLRIGNDGNSGVSPANGYIDDIRIYNRALSASERKQLYYQTRR